MPGRLSSLALVLLAAAPAALRADATLPPLFSDHLVLQRAASVPVWGRAEPGERISLDLGGVAAAETAAGADGRWRARLDLSDPRRAPAGPHTLTIRAKNTVVVRDVLIGEVWLASGQSNMARTMEVCGSPEEIAASANPRVRFFTVEPRASAEPLENIPGRWEIAGPKTTPAFSAVAYYFANRLQAELGAPVGVLHASRGSTPIEAWTSLDALRAEPLTAGTAETKIRRFLANDPETFPARKAAWLAALRPWLAAHDREDRPVSPATIAAWAAGPAGDGADGWSRVRLPGALPGERVLWVRREIDVPASAAGASVVLTAEEIVGIDTVYFDGRRIGGRTLETFGGAGVGRLDVRRHYRIPAEAMTTGRHTIAMRIHAPLGEAGVNGRNFAAGPIDLAGDWLLKTERHFPPLDQAARAAAPRPLEAPTRAETTPSFLFNGMIGGLAPFGLRGVIWYQGEGDAGNPVRYRTTFPLLINDWRARWRSDDDATQPLSFYWCQLPGYQAKPASADSPPGWASIREAQALALSLPRTGQAVLIDTGEAGDLHPRDKRVAGARLAAIALARDYARPVEFSGPVFAGMAVEGASIRVRFAHLGGGLVARPVPAEYLHVSTPERIAKPLKRNRPGSQLEGFAIRGGPDGKWEWADARIEGDAVVVSSPRVAAPSAVRYAWHGNPTGNLYNAAGLPAAPFRTDDD